MTWPSRWGGGERTGLERYVVVEEMLAAGAPIFYHWILPVESAVQVVERWILMRRRAGRGARHRAGLRSRPDPVLPDGYTLLLSASGPLAVALAVALALHAKVPYDVSRDFAPIAIVGEATMVLVSNPSFKPRSLKDLVAYSRANPMGVKAAINATGLMHHLLTELTLAETSPWLPTPANRIPAHGLGGHRQGVLAGNAGGGQGAVAIGSRSIASKFPNLGALMDEAGNDVLAFMTLPRAHWAHIYSTNRWSG